MIVLANPRVGDQVVIAYCARVRPMMLLHGQVGMVVIASRGKPRNHAVHINGTIYIVPCGNLNKVKP